MGFFDTLLGNSAAETANAAAGQTYKLQQDAIGGITKYGNKNRAAYQDLSTKYDPYVSGGGQGLSMLLNGLGLNGQEGSQAFTDAYQSLPGYREGLQTGTNAAMNTANSNNMLNSGRTLKELARFGSDYENMRSGDYLNRLTGLSGMGQTATGQQVATVGQGLQNQLATRQSAFQGGMMAAPTLGQGMVAGANAEQQGITNLLGLGAYGLGSYFGRK
jgi:hypothetical protein